ncbi:unnamed protein product [Meloidogyne enterolobii]|uniref:Uncharacterized protein n=1 Tax=Meloidogyne enterolobii TaxID=390850 RepID=A0ACB1AT56_MELEN
MNQQQHPEKLQHKLEKYAEGERQASGAQKKKNRRARAIEASKAACIC